MPGERYNYHFHFTDEETNVTDCGNLFSPTARQRQSQGWNPTAPDCKVYPLCFYSSSVCKYHILVAGVYFDTFLVFKFFKNLEKRKKKTHTTFSIRKYRCFLPFWHIFLQLFHELPGRVGFVCACIFSYFEYNRQDDRVTCPGSHRLYTSPCLSTYINTHTTIHVVSII